MGGACSAESSSTVVTHSRGVVELRNRGLSAVPKSVWGDATITELWLNQNSLSSLPKGLGNLVNLRGLYLLNNRLSSLPPQLGALKSLTKLYLSYNDLQTLPSEIGMLVALEELQVSNNKLVSLPASIGNLQHLRELDLGSNQIEKVPAEINGLTKLTSLDLDGNRISQMPSNLRGLQSLETLSVRNSALTVIPAEIGQLTALQELDVSKNLISTLPGEMKSLVQLRTLTISNNQLSVLPAVVGEMRSLEVLWLNNNQLTELPAQIGKLQNLRKLYLYNNALASLPDEIGDLVALQALQLQSNELATLPAAIGRLESLSELNLRENALVALPSQVGLLQSLKDFDVRHNKLTDLPQDLCEIVSLTRLTLNGNPLVKPPKEVSEAGITAILQYLRHEKYGEEGEGAPQSTHIPDLPDSLQADPVHLGFHIVKQGGDVVIDGTLKLWLGADQTLSRMTHSSGPDSLGSGEMAEVYLRGAILPDYDENGVQKDNYNHSWVQPHMCVPERLRCYRWRVVSHSLSDADCHAEIVVDKLHVETPKYIEKPLNTLQSKDYWLSSLGHNEVAYATGEVYTQLVFWMKLRLVPPDPVTTSAGTYSTREGDWSMHLSMSGDNDYRLVHPSAPSYRRYITCQGYRIDFLTFIPGDGTEWVPSGRGVLRTSSGKIPDISVALKITKLDPNSGEGLRRMSQLVIKR